MVLKINFRVPENKQESAARFEKISNYTDTWIFRNAARAAFLKTYKETDDCYVESEEFDSLLETFRSGLHELFNSETKDIDRYIENISKNFTFDMYKCFWLPELWSDFDDPVLKPLIEALGKLAESKCYVGDRFLIDEGFESEINPIKNSAYKNGVFSLTLGIDKYIVKPSNIEIVTQSRTGKPSTIDIGRGRQINSHFDNSFININQLVMETEEDELFTCRGFQNAVQLMKLFGPDPDKVSEGEPFITSICIENSLDEVLFDVHDYKCYTTEDKDGWHIDIKIEGMKGIFDFDMRLFFEKNELVHEIDETIPVNAEKVGTIRNHLKVMEELTKDKEDNLFDLFLRAIIGNKDRINHVAYEFCCINSTLMNDDPYELGFKTEQEKREYLKQFSVEGVPDKENFIYKTMFNSIDSAEERLEKSRISFICAAMAEGIESITLDGNNLRIKGNIKGLVMSNIRHYFDLAADYCQ